MRDRPVRLSFVEFSEHSFWQRVVEILGNLKISTAAPENAVPGWSLDGNQPRHWLTGFCNNYLFTKSDPVQDFGEMGLGVVEVYFHTLH